MDVYRAVAWLGWVPNLAIAEFLFGDIHARFDVGVGKNRAPAGNAGALACKRLKNAESSVFHSS